MDRDADLVPVQFTRTGEEGGNFFRKLEALQTSYRTIYVNLRRTKYLNQVQNNGEVIAALRRQGLKAIHFGSGLEFGLEAIRGFTQDVHHIVVGGRRFWKVLDIRQPVEKKIRDVLLERKPATDDQGNDSQIFVSSLNTSRTNLWISWTQALLLQPTLAF